MVALVRRGVRPARPGWLLVVSTCLGAACGRIGYDPLSHASDASGDSGANDVLDGLLARYTFDDGITHDSGGAHDALCDDGCPALDPAGFSGAALAMNGGPAHLQVLANGAFNTPQGFTVTGWVRYRAITARTCIMTKPILGTSNSWALCTDADRRPFFFACDACDSVFAPDPVEVDTWIHLAGSYDGTLKRFYVDGVAVGSAPGEVTFNNSAVVIGGDDDNGFGFATDGLIDDLRIYGRVLGDAEIAVVAGR